MLTLRLPQGRSVEKVQRIWMLPMVYQPNGIRVNTTFAIGGRRLSVGRRSVRLLEERRVRRQGGDLPNK